MSKVCCGCTERRIEPTNCHDTCERHKKEVQALRELNRAVNKHYSHRANINNQSKIMFTKK